MRAYLYLLLDPGLPTLAKDDILRCSRLKPPNGLLVYGSTAVVDDLRVYGSIAPV